MYTSNSLGGSSKEDAFQVPGLAFVLISVHWGKRGIRRRSCGGLAVAFRSSEGNGVTCITSDWQQ